MRPYILDDAVLEAEARGSGVLYAAVVEGDVAAAYYYCHFGNSCLTAVIAAFHASMPPWYSRSSWSAIDG